MRQINPVSSPVSRAKAFTGALLSLVFITLAAPALAEGDTAPEQASTTQIERLIAKRDALEAGDLEARGELDLRLTYAYESAGLEEKIAAHTEVLAGYLDGPISEDLKSYVFYTLFGIHQQQSDFETAFSILMSYDAGITPENSALRRYTIEQLLTTLYANLGYHARAYDRAQAMMSNPDFQGVEAFQRDRVANTLLLADTAARMEKGADAIAHVKAASGIFAEDLKNDPEFDEYVASLIRTDIDSMEISALIANGEDAGAVKAARKLIGHARKNDLNQTALASERMLGQALFNTGELEKAEAHLLAVTESKLFEAKGADDADVYRTLGHIYRARANYKDALDAYGQYAEMMSAWRKERDRNRIGVMAAQSENNQRMREIAELKASNAISASAARRSQQMALFGGVAALLALVAMVATYNSYRSQKKARETLDEYTQELEKSEARARRSEEKAKAASEAKSAFIANMSHEIRTPMNGVLGMAQILRASELNPQQKEYAETIHSSGSALLTIINDILDFSKIEAGKLELDPTVCNLRNAVEEVATMMATRAEEKGLEIMVRYAPGTPEIVLADIGRIRQMLLNLAGNAVKFTHQGHVLINIHGSASGDIADLKLEVLDTGIGIPEDRIDSIFDDFSQAENSTTRRFGGTGLGLAITRRLVDAMDGTIDVKSRHGRGSIFSISLQLPLEEDISPGVRKVPDLNDMRVLIVDDLKVNRQIQSEQFRAWNVEHAVADNGRTAFKMVVQAKRAGKPFDLVILDYHMPDVDGEQVASAIRRTPEVQDTRIIVLSSADSGSESRRFRNLNVSAYLLKPVRSSVFLDAIADAMSMDAHTVKISASPPEAPPLSPAAAPRADARQKLLVAEDNEVNRRVVAAFLKDSDLDVRFAVNGREALDFVKDQYFDLILMDVSMPEIDGLEATKAIRAHEALENLTPTPIICVSAHVMSDARDKAAAAGMDSHLSKPLLKEDLEQAIDTWIGVKRQRREEEDDIFEAAS